MVRPALDSFLFQATVQPKTMKAYRRAVRDFERWALANKMSLSSVHRIDMALAGYAHDYYVRHDGAGRQSVNCQRDRSISQKRAATCPVPPLL